MTKISDETIDNLREFMDRGCDYAGTQEVVDDLVGEALREMGSRYSYGEDTSLIDLEDHYIGNVSDFANLFWDKSVEAILNVIETED